MNNIKKNNLQRNYFVWGIVALLVFAIVDLLHGQINTLPSLLPSSIYVYSGRIVFFLVALFALAIVVKIEWGVVFLLLFFPFLSRFSEYYQINVGSVGFTVDSLLVYFLFFCNVIYRLKNNLFFFPGSKKLPLVLFLFIMFSLVSALLSNTVASVEVVLTGIIPSVLLYLVVFWNMHKYKYIMYVCKMLVCFLIASTLYTVYQPVVVEQVSLQDLLNRRWPSFYYNPIIFAGVLILLMPLYFIFWNSTKKYFVKFGLTLVALMSFVALVFTGSRGGVAVGFAQVVFYFVSIYKNKEKAVFLSRQKVKIKREALVSFFFLLLPIIFFFKHPPDVFYRFIHWDLSAPGSSGFERVLAVKAAFEIGFKNFWGTGAGNFQEGFLLTKAHLLGRLQLESAHNIFLNVFAEGGILSLLCFSFFMYTIFFQLKKNSKNKNYIISNTNIYLALCFYGFLIYSFLFYGEFQHRHSSIPYFLFMIVCGIISALYQYQDNLTHE